MVIMPTGRRGWAMLALVILLVGMATFPLRLAIALAGMERQGVSAQAVHGSVWRGRVDDLSIAGMRLGDMRARVAFLPLLIGRVRLEIGSVDRSNGILSGAYTHGFNSRGVDDMTGMVPLSGLLAPLPLSALEMEGVTVHFTAGHCAKAQGNVRLRLGAPIAGLPLMQGLSGPVRCDGSAAALTLVSQSGQEQVVARVEANGNVSAIMRVRKGDGVDAAAISAMGFQLVGLDYVLRMGRIG